jgi:hypothetical protein
MLALWEDSALRIYIGKMIKDYAAASNRHSLYLHPVTLY